MPLGPLGRAAVSLLVVVLITTIWRNWSLFNAHFLLDPFIIAMVTILLVSLDAFLVLMFREAMADAWNVDLIDMIGLPELIRFVTGIVCTLCIVAMTLLFVYLSFRSYRNPLDLTTDESMRMFYIVAALYNLALPEAQAWFRRALAIGLAVSVFVDCLVVFNYGRERGWEAFSLFGDTAWDGFLNALIDRYTDSIGGMIQIRFGPEWNGVRWTRWLKVGLAYLEWRLLWHDL